MAWAVLNNAVTGVFCVAHSVHSLERQNNKTWNWMRHQDSKYFLKYFILDFQNVQSVCVCLRVE